MENKKNLIARVINLCDAHSASRIDAELLLETTPREASYSSKLNDLLRREDQALREGNDDRGLFLKVDSQIDSETRAIFNKITAQNCQRWQSVYKRFEIEQGHFTSDVKAFVRSSPDSVAALNLNVDDASGGLGSDTSPARDTSEQSAALTKKLNVLDEMLRLENHYNEHWLEVEGYHLKEAFLSQESKIESEWAVHEDSLKHDLLAKRHALGMDSENKGGGLTSPTQAPTNSKWHSPEKQKTLVHTVPVMSPVRARGGAG